MQRFALIGHPLTHSFSKAYFNEKFQREGIEACYENFDIHQITDIQLIISQYADLKGFNVTIPYKEAIIPLLDEVDPTALEVGAVNTVKVMRDGRMKGFNTDVIGLGYMDCFASLAMTEAALILGTGGASKAVQYVLRQKGIGYHLVSRDAQRGDYTYKQLTRELIEQHPLIINATPLGTFPKVNEAPALPYDAIGSHHTLFDLVYNPEETVFLRQGRLRGAKTFNGLTMLHQQAEASWRIWTKNETDI